MKMQRRTSLRPRKSTCISWLCNAFSIHEGSFFRYSNPKNAAFMGNSTSSTTQNCKIAPFLRLQATHPQSSNRLHYIPHFRLFHAIFSGSGRAKCGWCCADEKVRRMRVIAEIADPYYGSARPNPHDLVHTFLAVRCGPWDLCHNGSRA